MKLFTTRIHSILFSIFLLIAYSAISQNLPNSDCETITSAENINYLKSINTQIKNFEQDFNQVKSTQKHKASKIKHNIPIKIHIIRNSDGSGGIDLYDLESAIENLNTYFHEAYMNFYLWGGIDYVDSDDYFNFKKGDEGKLSETHYSSGIINMYFTDYIENDSGSSICGYSVNKESSHIVVMKNSCTTNDSTLAHEMGHVFSLLHTHGASNTKMTTELADGSNCDTDGDGICDTPADPKLSSNVINNFCEYTGKKTDLNGNLFSPDTENIMSYSRKACRNHFTNQQLARMYAFFNSAKKQFIFSREDSETTTITNSFKNLSIYPNPVKSGNIHIKSSGDISDTAYQINNFQGQTLLKGKSLNREINVNQLPSGSYLLIIENSNSRVIKKFIKY
jgi:hypothetical protein